MRATVIPVWYLLAGSVLALLLARLAGPLSWPRGLVVSACGAVFLMALLLARAGLSVGATPGPSRSGGFQMDWVSYGWALGGAAVVGLAGGVLLLGILRLIARFGG